MKVATKKERCQTELGAYAPYIMYQRARRSVLKEMQSSYVEEFANLWDLLLSCFTQILDGNNQMFPVVWEIVMGKGKES
ncbi:hypothetical protein V6N13_074749 [Hibiscus sabdariffa]